MSSTYPRQSYAAMTDAELVALAKQRDSTAFGVLIGRYRAEVQSIVGSRTGDVDRAEEITQDACARAWEKMHQCRSELSFGGWLMRIALNLLSGAGRTAARHERHLRHQASRGLQWMTVGPDEPSPVDLLAWDAQVTALEAALRELTPKTREAFVLRHGMDMSFEEMAERTGCTPNTAKIRVHRARLALQKVLRRQGKCDLF